MKIFIAVLLLSVLSSAQGVFSGTGSTTGGFTAPISNNLVSLTLTPPTATLTVGSSANYTATATTALGTQFDFTGLVTWDTTNHAIATVGVRTTTQKMTCVGPGSVTVTGTSGLIVGSSPLICQPPPATGAHNEYCTSSGTWIGATTDGPATLPNQCYYTPLSATPSPGTVRGPVSTAAAFNTAYAAAACGDVIQVTAGSSITGPITMNGKSCDDAHYITIESTGISDAKFPVEGARATPCYSNIASLPNRASYPCATPALLTAQFVATSSNNAVYMQADHIRWIGIEFTRVSTPGALIFALVDLGSTAGSIAQESHHVIFDRCWFHGINADGAFPQTSLTDTSTTRALFLAQSHHVAVIDSYISDIYDNGSVASNGNTDAQCVSGGSGSFQASGWGIYKFVNNHCEGASEGVILGGSGGPAVDPPGCTLSSTCTLDVPTDIEVRLNYFFAPNSWNGNTTSPVSTGYPNRKNGVEFKTGARILLEANLFENCWYSSQPFCYVFDFAPKNQMNNVSDPGTCPSCLVQDFTARYNYGYNYPGHSIALYTASFVGGCVGCGQTLGRRGSIHDNLVGDNLNRGQLSQTGFDCVEFAATAGPISNVSFRHNTCVGAYSSMMLEGANNTVNTGQLDNITFQDNLMSEGLFGVQAYSNAGSGCDGGGTGFPNYDSSNNWLGILNACINGVSNTWTANHNVVWGANTITNWPTGNTLLASISNVGFTTVPGNNAAGFPDSGINASFWALTSGSAYHNAASDGTDIGADIPGLVSKLTNVRDSPSQQFTPGNLKIFPASSTVEQGTKVPFACDKGTGAITCSWTVASGVGSVDANGNYTAPNAGGSAVLQAVSGSNLVTANITISGTTPTAAGDCATLPYPHSGLTENICHMSHAETVGGPVTRNWKVVVPTNYVSGQSGMILHVADNHFLNATNGDPCGPPTNEVEGWANYLNTVPAPAPVLVCSEGYSSSSGTFSVYNSLGRLNYNWLGAVVPNDVDFLRQLILITVRDMNLNPKAVFVENYFNSNGNGGMAVQAASVNSDLVAGVGAEMESNFEAMNSSFTVNRTGAANFGQTLAAPAVPVSVITLTGLYVAQVGVFSQICGNNLAPSAQQYQPLTVDDTFRYWNQTNATTASAFSPSNVSSFCLGTYDGSGNGLPSTLEVRKDTGGKLGTAIYAYKLVGNTSKATPFCSYDYNGANTLGCGANSSTAVMDFRNSVCTFSQPCNHFLDAGTGPASASGYSTVDMLWKFFKNHPKP